MYELFSGAGVRKSLQLRLPGSLTPFFTKKAGSSAFNPGAVSGLKLWLKADALSLNDNDAVSSWADSSGQSNTVTQATGSKQPVYKTNVANGMPAVRFDGVDDFLATAAAPVTTVADNFTMICVAESDDSPATGRVVLYNGSGNSSGYGIFPAAGTGGSSGKVAGLFGMIAWLSSTVNTPANGTFSIYIMRRTSGTYKLWLNGGSNIKTGANTPNVPAGRTFVGTDELSGGRFAAGDILESMIFDESVSDANMNLLGSYLATKYGITWTTLV